MHGKSSLNAHGSDAKLPLNTNKHDMSNKNLQICYTVLQHTLHKLSNYAEVSSRI